VTKRLVILVLLAAFLLSAVSPWPAVLTVVNYTGENIYFRLKYRGEQKYFLTATPEGNSSSYYVSRFDVVRRTYTSNEVTACETTTTWARFDLNNNLRLVFTPCESMKQYWTPKYWGEPGMEKPNFWNDGSSESVPPNGTWWGQYKYKFPSPPCSTMLKGKKSCGGRAFHFLYDVVP
jgi:hypothetical protein